jgi:ATP-binding cassette subfamily G (WHITE) protein 2 (SNQ2)
VRKCPHSLDDSWANTPYPHFRYEPANRQTTPDFLVAVTNPNGRILRRDISNAMASGVPHTADDFATHFRKSRLGEANRTDVGSYIKEFVENPKRGSVYIESARAERAAYMRQARCENARSGLL